MGTELIPFEDISKISERNLRQLTCLNDGYQNLRAPVRQTGFYALCGALDRHTERAATGKVVERIYKVVS